jgi:ubiquinol-cytochrome c reductase cytochrome c1 subunit
MYEHNPHEWRAKSFKSKQARGAARPVFMMGRISLAALALLAAAAPGLARASESGLDREERPRHYEWSFAGAFGRYDSAQLRRGFKVYREVCSSCHSIKLLSFRNLDEPGGPEYSADEVAQLAASYKVKDGPNAAGDYFDRPGRPSDRFPAPFANEQAARAALAGGYPPDMSVLAKARGYSRGFPTFLLDVLPGFSYQEAGVDYIASLLQGYQDPPRSVTLGDGQFYNIYMPGRRILMVPPLADGAVKYDDKTPQTVEQYAKDVSAFLMWAAEPHLNKRKSVGVGVVSFLVVFAALLLFVKRRVWASVDH